MTIQANDYLNYNNRKFTLIDIEKGKQLIESANFIMPKYIGKCICSGCWRGYTADYRIDKSRLYGIRHERGEDWHKIISSKEMPLNFTGGCIIAINNDENNDMFCISDFLQCYIDYEEAYEIHFTNGVLDEVFNLHTAIEEFRCIEKSKEYEEIMQPYQRSELREEIARKYLRYSYDKRSYKCR